ncbi:MAPEG family protein [Paralimibaculum aggregatum]|uniref:MAPEG family protein n=1 Tax=Paralimibaculum aggregatum TaxID=3036245 RepID=A0ABQ6LL68_9RHOB|nr:MAPEG family protein [Limibaculum sp. NKW23]GMG83015.1 MAPEG family protein [Limibaculum sp. NKW23]
MPETTSPEIFWLAATALATAVMWVPYILWMISDRGLGPALMDGEHDIAYTVPWAARAVRAHRNAVENLVVFGVLALAVQATGTGTALTAQAAALFFFVRVAHYGVYVAGMPVVRTLLFAVGVGCQIVLGLAVLGWI